MSDALAGKVAATVQQQQPLREDAAATHAAMLAMKRRPGIVVRVLGNKGLFFGHLDLPSFFASED